MLHAMSSAPITLADNAAGDKVLKSIYTADTAIIAPGTTTSSGCNLWLSSVRKA
jgi:hypothetical protein